MHLENWDDLKFVLAMKRHGTMSAAARFMDTNVATVSRRIDRLSEELDVPLFEKRGQSFVSTPAADSLAEVADLVDQQLRTALSTLHMDDVANKVSLEIAAPPAVHSHYIMPRMQDLTSILPQLALELTDKAHAQGLGEADIQIRIGRPDAGRLKARKFRDYSLRVFHGEDHVLDGEWIGLSQRYPESDMVRDIYKDADTLPRYRLEEMTSVYRMVCATGLPGLLPDFMVTPGDGLVLADMPDNCMPGELWIAYHETRHGDATLRSTVDWLCSSNL